MGLSDERQRWLKLAAREHALYEKGYKKVAGVDEAGRGPIAGPVVAAACCVPKDFFLAGVDDSKKLSARQRIHIYEQVTNESAVHYGIGVVHPQTIDQINILQAALLAMRQAISAMSEQPDMLLVDGNCIKGMTIAAEAVVGGDSSCYCIALASILAKVHRDRIMEGEYHEKWPVYNFKDNKGYPTAYHRGAVKQHGPAECHRFSYAPIAELVASAER